MKATTNGIELVTEKDIVDVAGTELSKVFITIGMGTAGLIGIWAAACMIAGLAHGGLIEAIKNYAIAVTGY
jgi:hypothetical protein